MDIDRIELLKLYETMVKIRLFEEAVLQVVLAGEVVGGSQLYIGEEAIAAGVCANLTKRDQICSTYRGHGHCIAKGGDINRMMAEVFGRATGYCNGRVGAMHISDREIGILGANGIVGAGSPIAVGSAFAQKYLKTNDVTVVFFGDGASNRGTQHEAMNMASIWNLPVIFVVENNGFGFYTPQKQHQKIENISTRASAYGFKGVTADGNDVLEVFSIARDAAEQCRRGEGPVLLEFKTWRHLGHFVGDSCAYKDPKEQEYWLTQKDPITNFGKYLIEKGIVSGEGDLESVKANIKSQIDAALKFARESPLPDPKIIHVDTYFQSPELVLLRLHDKEDLS